MPSVRGAAGRVSGALIVGYALRFRGQGYVFGGPGWPPGNWDCSSFASTVLGRGGGLRLPGGGRWGDAGYPPHTHGPVVLDYASWAGAQTVPRGLPGDIVVWPGALAGGHMGIVTGPGQMISALNPQLGTIVTPIAGYGPAGITPVYRRLTGVAGIPPMPPGPYGSGGQVALRLAVLAGAGLLIGAAGIMATMAVLRLAGRVLR